MNLRLIREPSQAGATLGVLFVNGVFACWTLEDQVRSGVKVDGATAIPAGRYRLSVTPSQRFGRLMPLVENVPGFDGIRIHSGNTSADTEGCILVGAGRGPATVTQSVIAFNALFPRLQAACLIEPVSVSIEDAPTNPSLA